MREQDDQKIRRRAHGSGARGAANLEHERATRACVLPLRRLRRATHVALGLALAGALLAPAGSALALPIAGGHTFALALPGFTEGLEDVSVSVEGASSLLFGLVTEFPISGGEVEGPDGFIPFTGTFEHDGTALRFARGGNEVAFRNPVVDTLTLGVRATVDVFSGGVLVESRPSERIFDLAPFALPGLPLPFGDPALGFDDLGLGGFGLALPAVIDVFGEEILLDLLLASYAFETETILSEALFGGGPIDLAGRTAAFLAVVGEVGAPVPEPGAALLALGGLAALVSRGRRLRH